MADSQQIAQLTELVAVMRSLIEKSQYINASSNALAALLTQSKALEAAFTQHSGTHRLLKLFGDMTAAPKNSEDWALRLPYGIVTGVLNPLAPPLQITGSEDGKLCALARLETIHEGPPHAVNGGTIAAIYDHLLSFATMAFAQSGPTAKLEIRYLAKTPLHTELRFESWVSKQHGRKIHAAGRCYAGDLLCSEASALFIKFEQT